MDKIDQFLPIVKRIHLTDNKIGLYTLIYIIERPVPYRTDFRCSGYLKLRADSSNRRTYNKRA